MEYLEYGIMDYIRTGQGVLKIGQICIGMLECLRAFHNKGFIHRDVKPENFRIHNDRVYIIDYGLCREFKTRDGKHITYAAGKQFKGTPYTSSIFSHQAIEQSRRDDLISMVYSAMMIFEGTIPWSEESGNFIDTKKNPGMM
jgi:serine/threonine protein kinase